MYGLAIMDVVVGLIFLGLCIPLVHAKSGEMRCTGSGHRERLPRMRHGMQ